MVDFFERGAELRFDTDVTTRVLQEGLDLVGRPTLAGLDPESFQFVSGQRFELTPILRIPSPALLPFDAPLYGAAFGLCGGSSARDLLISVAHVPRKCPNHGSVFPL